MLASVTKHWYADHRAWEDYLSAGLGVLTVLSPLIMAKGVDTTAMINAGVVGVLIAALAMLELMSLRRWEELLEAACGAWLFASPFVFGYGEALRSAHLVLGVAVLALAVLELWQDRRRLHAG